MKLIRTGFGEAGLPVLPIFFVSAAVGILAMNLGKGILLDDTGLFDEYILYGMKYMTVDNDALFSYILRERMIKLLALAVLSTTYLGLAACVCTIVWCGMSAGALFAALTLRYGIKGIILAFVSLFPQYLFYIPAILGLLVWCTSLYRGIYNRTINFGEDKTFLPKKLAKLSIILLAATAGCLLEAYVNPYLLLNYLKIF